MLLILQKVCNQKAIKLPWDDVGAQLGGTITGGAIIQHLAKLRARRIDQGLPVPEPLKRGGGGSITLSGGVVNGTNEAKKERQAKRPAGFSVNTSNDDEEEDFDVDKASDPEASFGEGRKKRIKYGADDADDDIHSAQKKSKARKSNKNKNTNAAKRHRAGFSDEAWKRLGGESSPEALNMTAVERAGRRISTDSAKLHNEDSDPDSDNEMNEPHVAAGSSFLKLEGVSPVEYEEKSLNEHYNVKSAEDDEYAANYEGHMSRDASVSPGQEDTNSNNITVLRLGTNERSAEFLKSLDSSYAWTAPLDYTSSGAVGNINIVPANVSHQASIELGMNGASRTMTSQNFNHQYISNGIGTNFGEGNHSQYNNSPYTNAYIGSSGAPYSSVVPAFMPPTPLPSQGYNGFPPGFSGNNMAHSQYQSLYGSGGSVQGIKAPQSPVGGGGFLGQTEYTPGIMLRNAIPSAVLPSHILQPAEYSSLSSTRKNSMSTNTTTNGYQNSQNYVVSNNQAKKVDLDNGEKLTSLYPLPSYEQHDPTMSYDMGLGDDFLNDESFGAVFDRLVGEPDEHDL